MNTKQREELQTAIDIARDEWNLHDVDITVELVTQVGHTLNRGDATNYHNGSYRIRLARHEDRLVQTLGHELRHIWMWENGKPHNENLADAYGDRLETLMGLQLRCCRCQKTMSHFEAEESELGMEFTDELICDKCYHEAVAR